MKIAFGKKGWGGAGVFSHILYKKLRNYSNLNVYNESFAMVQTDLNLNYCKMHFFMHKILNIQIHVLSIEQQICGL